MEDLFGQNMLVFFVISVIAIISYSNFEEKQRMFLIYLLTYGTAYFRIFRIYQCALLLILSTFLFLEYLSDDQKKLEIITKPVYKLLDYGFMMVFQFHVCAIAAAFLLLYLHHISSGVLQTVLLVVSLGMLCCGGHLTITQPFKVKSISEIMRTFNQHPYYMFRYDDRMQQRFALLCEFEDHTYFERENSYSCFSLEYFRMKFRWKKVFRMARRVLFPAEPNTLPLKKRLVRRGFSTPEMQLLRTIGVERGYDRHKFQRKIYEAVYSKIFFASFKQYHKDNAGFALERYREYLLSVYLQTVLTKVNGTRYNPFSSAFENDKDMTAWPMEGMFVACMGLSFRTVNPVTLGRYEDIIWRYGLNSDKIIRFAEALESNQKIPADGPRTVKVQRENGRSV